MAVPGSLPVWPFIPNPVLTLPFCFFHIKITAPVKLVGSLFLFSSSFTMSLITWAAFESEITFSISWLTFHTVRGLARSSLALCWDVFLFHLSCFRTLRAAASCGGPDGKHSHLKWTHPRHKTNQMCKHHEHPVQICHLGSWRRLTQLQSYFDILNTES